MTETLYPIGIACDLSDSVSGLCRFQHALTADAVTVGFNYMWGGRLYAPLEITGLYDQSGAFGRRSIASECWPKASAFLGLWKPREL